MVLRRHATAFRESPLRGVCCAVLAIAVTGVMMPISSSPLAAGTDGDAARGEGVAVQWCGMCHSVSGRETDPDRAPTFEEIAARPGRDGTWFARFLDEDHFPMTTFRLFDDEKRDVVAFLLSLRGD
jgi:mono/diheme cytochrome c family protein